MTENTTERLRSRFEAALATAGASSPTEATERVFAELLERHAEAHRRYHTMEHVGACLGWLDWYAAHAQRPAEVSLALFFHDAIYDPEASDNEARSAALAREKLAELGVEAESIERIAAHILATKAHGAAEGDTQLVVDLDLTILGARRPVYDDFERRIREEYAHVPEALFRDGRRAVLEAFLSRAPIYRTPPLAEELEKRARANLERRVRELATLVS